MGDHKPNDDKFEGRTYLYIRTHPADSGSEPLPSGLQHWVSPDILIQQPGGALGAEAIANANNQVLVTVTNAGGIDANDAYVDAYFCNPATGFTPATAMLIGADFLTIPGYNTATIQFPWMPTAADAGHRCLMARVCLTFPPDCYLNGSIFDVKGDRHVAQRNIQVVAPAADQNLLEGFGFGLDIVNPLGRPGEFMLGVMEVRNLRNPTMIQQALRCGFARMSDIPLGQVGLQLGERLPPLDRSIPQQERGLPTGVIPKLLEDGERSQTIGLDTNDVVSAAITIRRSPDALPGTLNLVQLVQFDIEGGQAVGGLWIVVQN